MNELIQQIMTDFDVKLCNDKGLCSDNKLTDKYYNLTKNYRILLEKYLLSKLPLKECEDIIDNSGLHFIPLMSNDMDIYQLLSSLGLKYIYLRNGIYVEKLSNGDIDVLSSLTVDELKNPSDKLFDLIERTYKVVIDSKPINTEVVHMNCYGPDNSNFWFDSSEMVFGIRHNEFADNGLGQEEEWQNNFYKQNEFLTNMIGELACKCRDILGIKVNFIRYNEFTVKSSMKR